MALLHLVLRRCRWLIFGIFVAVAVACGQDSSDDTWTFSEPDDNRNELPAGACLTVGGLDRLAVWGEVADPRRCVEIRLLSPGIEDSEIDVDDLALNESWQVTAGTLFAGPCESPTAGEPIQALSGILEISDEYPPKVTVDMAIDYGDPADGNASQTVRWQVAPFDAHEAHIGDCLP